MAEFVLENECMKVTVSSKGCELVSVIRKKDGREFLWNANPDVWKRHAPVLFPLVGRYRNDEVQYQNQRYHMTQHGFARDMEFELVSYSSLEIWMKLCDNEETRGKYPFSFELFCGYQLKGHVVKVLWKVKNTGNETMYFSIGGHPAFVGAKSSLSEAGLAFSNVAKPLRYHLLSSKGLLLDETYEVQLDEQGILPLTSDFFDKDALVFEDGQCREISLLEDGNMIVTVKFDAPVFGIWSAAKKNVPFVCIEPWYGRTDRENFAGTLEMREWGNCLEVGKTFEADYDLLFAKKE